MTELVLSQTINELVLEDTNAILEVVEQNFEMRCVAAEQGPAGPPGGGGSEGPMGPAAKDRLVPRGPQGEIGP